MLKLLKIYASIMNVKAIKLWRFFFALNYLFYAVFEYSR